MTKEVLGLIPVNGCVLVELKQSYTNIHIKQGKYDSHTEGLVIYVDDREEDYQYLKGKRIFFEEFKEGARIKRNGKIYSFIKIEDIRGFEEV